MLSIDRFSSFGAVKAIRNEMMFSISGERKRGTPIVSIVAIASR